VESSGDGLLPAAGRSSKPWARQSLGLVAITAGYNTIEAVVAIASGLAAGSVALIAFGLDSLIELAAACVVLWRLRIEFEGADELDHAERIEQRARRFVGWTFLALAAYVTADVVLTFWRHERPRESLIGIILAIASAIVMPVVAWGKLSAAAALQSRALRGEALETLACAWLSLTLLIGLAANAAFGWWWADPLAAAAMVPWLVREGLEGAKD